MFENPEAESTAPPAAPLAGGLADLRDEARREDQPAPGPGAGDPGAAAAPAVQPAETWEDWRDALKIARAWSVGPYPALAGVYTDEAIDQLAQAIYAVCKKRGWSLSVLFVAWKEEITLLMIAGPLLRDTARVVKAGKGAAPAGDPGAAAPAQPAPPPPGALRPNTGA